MGIAYIGFFSRIWYNRTMFYEPDKPRKKRRSGCLTRAVKLVMLLAAAWLVVVVLTSGAIPDLIDTLTGRSGGLPGGWTHILLLGKDQSNEGASRTDSMMIASVSSGGAVKLTSLMRDMLVNIEGHGRQKLNAAYAHGGAELAMKTVNQALGLNISRYAVLDFQGFAGLVDAVGGVEVSVTKQEMQAINKKKGHKLGGYGEDMLLDGVQALRYSRIRKIDSDYMRASRQRKVLDALVKKARAIKNPIAIVSLANAALQEIRTNVNGFELVALGMKTMMNGAGIAQFRIPAEGTYESGMQDGVWSIRADLEKNKTLFRTFVYGQ